MAAVFFSVIGALLQSALALEAGAVAGAHLELHSLGIAQHVERDVDTRTAEAPDAPEHIRETDDGLVVDADDDVARAQPRFVGRTVAIDADDGQVLLVVVHEHAEPRARW